MATNWKSENTKTTCNKSFGTTLSSWSRQEQLALAACLAILGIVLVVSACSKQFPKPALAGVPDPAAKSISQPAATAVPQGAAATPQDAILPTSKKKVQRKRPANVTYSDPVFGVSFSYPRKFVLESAGNTKSEPVEMDGIPMNFVHQGGVAVATVALPGTLYPGTDFESGFFRVNVNRSLSEQECPHFAFVDTSDADGEPIDAQKVKVGPTAALKEMEMTSEFEGIATRQLETQYYHSYENGACYEYVLGLGTAGYGTGEGIQPVNRDEVFARLEKILASVKTRAVAEQSVAQEQPPLQNISPQQVKDGEKSPASDDIEK